MAKFRKKPVEIEAFQMTARTLGDKSLWPEWLVEAANKDRTESGALFIPEESERHSIGMGVLCIQTLEGAHTVSDGDWIIQGVQGELYPCKPDIFEATYDEA